MSEKPTSPVDPPRVKPVIGLALSGGGFRASFFHIGVLARLAELDVLRSIEAISTVSGGSIIGALYYLHLKKLLECKRDEDVHRSDYINIVSEIETSFLKGVEKNIRMRTFTNLWRNLRMYGRDYSRSDRISELYDKYFYAPVIGKENVPLAELYIQPKGFEGNFHPDFYNTGRKAKIPRLIINATCLNTGHNWQFTASHMGEPPQPADDAPEMKDIDKNTRLRRLYYHESSVPKIRRTPLRVAVGASAAVPGLFPPLPITELYDDMIVQLVDGGVYDNQGVMSLLHEGCRSIIVSDASGQLEDEDLPKPTLLATVGRSNQILMDVVRESDLGSLYLRKRLPFEDGERVENVRFVHLKKELPQPEKTWIGGTRTAMPPDQRLTGMTSYGVDRNVQALLSCIRTDLDSFTEVEAYSLMMSAYKMSVKEFDHEQINKICPVCTPKNRAEKEETGLANWKFSSVEEFMGNKAGNRLFVKQLDTGSQRAFKAIHIAPIWLKAGLLALAVTLAGFLLWQGWLAWNDGIFHVERNLAYSYDKVLMGLGLLIIPLLFPTLPWTKIQRNYLREWLVRIVVALSGWISCWIHLLTFDLLFKTFGRVNRLKSWKGVDY